jgi:hypothetical protein
MKMKKSIIYALFGLTVFFLQTGAQAAVHYVNVGNSVSGNGTSWSSAYKTIQEGIDAAASAGGGDVWVAGGTYYIYSTSSNDTLRMKSGVNLYGGFAGNETAREQRNWNTNKSIIDGHQSSGSVNQVQHVVTGSDNAVIDGFTITGGKSGGGGPGRAGTPRSSTSADAIISGGGAGCGAGMLIFQTSPTVSNCTFSGNSASKGGGVYVMVGTEFPTQTPNAAPTFTDCIFSDNTAGMRGGGVANDVASHPTFIRCRFINNSCDAKGGAMYNDFGCSPTLINCLIAQNTAERASALGCDGTSSPKLINCTVTDNDANDVGAGIYTGSYLAGANEPILVNSIVWGNKNQWGGPTDFNVWHENHFYISYSLIGKGFTGYGEGVIQTDTADPLFADPENGDYRLQSGSPCINSGTASDSDIPDTDLNGETRDSIPDMGAYEYTGTINTGTLTVNIEPSGIGGQWSPDGGSTWYGSGAAVTMAEGTCTVSFSTVSGYDSPAAQSVTVTAGATEVRTGTYVLQIGTGTLTVNTEPSGIGGQWSPDGGSTWYGSGAAVTIAEGTYTVTFSTVSGYDSPAAHSVTVTAGATEVRTGTYVLQNTPEPYPGYTLFMPINAVNVYLIGNNGNTAHTWESVFNPGLSVYLLENGNLLRTAKTANTRFDIAGRGGKVMEIAPDGGTVWEYAYSDEQAVLHHDIEYMPNGNILMIAWEYKSDTEAIAAGRNPDNVGTGGLYPDMIIEVNPLTNTIVWEWHVWDHLVQDYDAGKANYGSVAAHPERIDLNFVQMNPDWTHFNSIAYHEEFDQIMVSVHEFSEIWIIDHSTTTEEAAGHTGGNSGKGGDLLYRWGNPQAYDAGSASDQKLFKQHDAQWIDAGYPGSGNILIFNNGMGRPGGNSSSVEEITPPVDGSGNYAMSNSVYGPESAAWTYDLPVSYYSSNISGAQRLPNGNTLICSGANGYFLEVTADKESAWEYTWSGGDVFKVRRYGEDDPGLPEILNPSGNGSLQVSLEPADAVTAGAQWQMDGGSWQNSGVTVSGIRAGTHMITYKAPEGWTAPAGAYVNISAGQTATAAGTYTQTCIAGDIDGNGIRLSDAVAALQILTGISPAAEIRLCADVNSDEKIGMQETVYILQEIAEIR